MAERKPVLLAVDDDREVVRAVERDLRNHYARDFTVLAAGSGEEALELIRRLVPRGDPLALVVTDQRMPRMTGVELLAHVAAEAPDAKRVLLTAYADTEVAMRAINEIRLDHYLMKPWHPPEERLYPVLDDLLGGLARRRIARRPRLADADGDARVRDRRPAVGRRRSACATCWRTTRSRTAGSTWRTPAPRQMLAGSIAHRRPAAGRARPGLRAARQPPIRPRLRSGSACRRTRSSRTTTSSSSAPAPPGSRPPSTAPPRGCARSSSSGSRSAARPE